MATITKYYNNISGLSTNSPGHWSATKLTPKGGEMKLPKYSQVTRATAGCNFGSNLVFGAAIMTLGYTSNHGNAFADVNVKKGNSPKGYSVSNSNVLNGAKDAAAANTTLPLYFHYNTIQSWSDCTDAYLTIDYKPPTVTISTSKEGEGTVTPTSTHEVNFNTVTKKLTATPAAGWKFDYWIIGSSHNTNQTITVTVNENHLVGYQTTFYYKAHFSRVITDITNIYIGTVPAKEIYIGTTPIREVYAGTTLIYKRGT